MDEQVSILLYFIDINFNKLNDNRINLFHNVHCY
jgi:hypothetical protein